MSASPAPQLIPDQIAGHTSHNGEDDGTREIHLPGTGQGSGRKQHWHGRQRQSDLFRKDHGNEQDPTILRYKRIDCIHLDHRDQAEC